MTLGQLKVLRDGSVGEIGGGEKAALIVARTSRLARNVAFGASILETPIKFIACDAGLDADRFNKASQRSGPGQHCGSHHRPFSGDRPREVCASGVNFNEDVARCIGEDSVSRSGGAVVEALAILRLQAKVTGFNVISENCEKVYGKIYERTNQGEGYLTIPSTGYVFSSMNQETSQAPLRSTRLTSTLSQ